MKIGKGVAPAVSDKFVQGLSFAKAPEDPRPMIAIK
jgi:hypothetical protein